MSGFDTCKGWQCLVDWDSICLPKNLGGLGLSRLDIPNQCLLMKLTNNIINQYPVRWVYWCTSHQALDLVPAPLVLPTLEPFFTLPLICIMTLPNVLLEMERILPSGLIARLLPSLSPIPFSLFSPMSWRPTYLSMEFAVIILICAYAPV